MQLSLRADYALRVLLYLSAHPQEIVSTQRISDAYAEFLKQNHLVRVLQTLGEHGYVKPGHRTRRRLCRWQWMLEDIRLGEVVRAAEPRPANCGVFRLEDQHLRNYARLHASARAT